jgi:hypothetical protein
MEPFYLLRRDPLWCGLILYRFRFAAYQASLATAATCASAVLAAHVYNCLQQEKMLSYSWTDMEEIFDRQSIENIFVGNRPKSEGYVTNLEMAMGKSATAFARNRRNRQIDDVDFRRARHLQLQAPVHQILYRRYCESSGAVDFEPDAVREIILRSQRTSDRSKVTRSAEKVHACTVLKSLAESLQSETHEVAFDYGQMHMVCWKFLLRLSCELGLLDTSKSGVKNRLGAVFFLLEHAPASSSKRGPLKKAADALKATIQSHGVVVSSKREEALNGNGKASK